MERTARGVQELTPHGDAELAAGGGREDQRKRGDAVASGDAVADIYRDVRPRVYALRR